MFLFNDFQGDPPEKTRHLSAELTQALVDRKISQPDLKVLVISDPVNTVYGGQPSKHFEALRQAGVPVILTRLDKLRDSNPSYSSFWRLLVKPLWMKEGGLLPNPFGDGKVSIISYLALLNFKANHRKLVIADQDDKLVGLVTSANPHDGSSAHGNVALSFTGSSVLDLIDSERAVVAFSSEEDPLADWTLPNSEPASKPFEKPVILKRQAYKWSPKARFAWLYLPPSTEPAGATQLDMAVFYLSDHGVVDGLVAARKRGASVRVLLDPNKDAFGRKKKWRPQPSGRCGLKRQPYKRALVRHPRRNNAMQKMLNAHYATGDNFLLLGSANFTRRNLQDLNLETSVVVRGLSESAVFQDAKRYFNLVWHNESGRTFSVEYEVYADESLRKKIPIRSGRTQRIFDLLNRDSFYSA